MKKISYLNSILPELEVELPNGKALLKWRSFTHNELQKINEEISKNGERFERGEITLNQLFVESNSKMIDCENWDLFLSLPQHILAQITEEVNQITLDFYSGKIKKKME